MEQLANIASGNVLVRSLPTARFQSSGTCTGYKPCDVVLKGPKCWCPKESQKNQNQWLQLDFGEVKTVHGFETQGHGSHGGHWCQTIRFETSIDGTKWHNEGVFQANKGPTDIKNNKLKQEKYAKYVRFYPQKCGGGHGGWGKLRVEIFWTEALNFIPEQEQKDGGEQKTQQNRNTDKTGKTGKTGTTGKTRKTCTTCTTCRTCCTVVASSRTGKRGRSVACGAI